MNNQYNVWNTWDPLKTVMLGDTYPAEFYKDIKNNNIRSALTRISDETREDLEVYSNVLKDFGCEVLRPKLKSDENIMNYINEETGQLRSIPYSPMQPRDAQAVIGNKLFLTRGEAKSTRQVLHKYNSDDTIQIHNDAPVSPEAYKDLRDIHDDGQWPSVEQYIEHQDDVSYFPIHVWGELYKSFDAPQITVAGNDIYIDKMVNLRNKSGIDTLVNHEYIKDNFLVNRLSIGGHNDACFAAIKEGVVLSLNQIQKYEKTFPGWDVCYLKDQSWAKIKPFLTLKNKNKGSFWVPGQEENDEFTHFVMTWLNNWVGYVEETVFDVNVLVLDEHHVCVSQMDNPIVNAFLKKYKMEPIYVPHRHRYFWDGGLHCITLDLYREGKQQDYFPERTECVVCEGY